MAKAKKAAPKKAAKKAATKKAATSLHDQLVNAGFVASTDGTYTKGDRRVVSGISGDAGKVMKFYRGGSDTPLFEGLDTAPDADFMENFLSDDVEDSNNQER